MSDLEPANGVSPRNYLVGYVSLVFRDSENREFYINEFLYGESGIVGTLRQLRPGEWFIVKGRKKIEGHSADWGGQQLRNSGSVPALVTATSGKIPSDILCEKVAATCPVASLSPLRKLMMWKSCWKNGSGGFVNSIIYRA
jgi:hypothetical protein